MIQRICCYFRCGNSSTVFKVFIFLEIYTEILINIYLYSKQVVCLEFLQNNPGGGHMMTQVWLMVEKYRSKGNTYMEVHFP